jgi:hypothetical protein
MYDAIERGDAELVRALWFDDHRTTCTHPGSLPVRGTDRIVRSWTALMAATEYLQFFLTDVCVLPVGEDVVVITCVENILAGESLEAFANGRVTSTSVLHREGSGWKYWARHASPILEMSEEDDEDIDGLP